MAKKKKFRDLSKMAEYMLGHEIMQRPVVMLAGAAYNTAYLKECIERIAAVQVRLLVGEAVSPLERLGLELLMQIFDVEFGG